LAAPDAAALREMAANRGLKLVRSRLRTPGKGDYGRYGLTDAGGAQLLGFGRSGLTATAEEIEAYLHKGAAADWKTSLRAVGAKAPAPARKRAPPKAEPEPVPEPEPEVEPEPPPLAIRPARPRDSEAIAALVTKLGFAATADEIAERLATMKKAPPLVAEQGEVIGILTWNVTGMLHRPQPVGRITMMAVAEGERRRGVGRALVDAACERLRAAGCGLVEVTSNVDLSGAHSFYRKLGFERTSYRFARKLD
jgi:ribosomal protein S18 acetylase RimI-like enzyme